jgi:lipopolysaccharide transport system ATP-binding protein
MIKVEHISKEFKLYHNPSDRLKEIVFRRTLHRKFFALKDVSFEVEEGQSLGVVGQNGAGKSTLLKILTGVLLPDSGTIHVDGRITGILELGTGFNAEFTGLQNIYLNGTLLGVSKKEIDERLDAIIGFSELGEFIREPIKVYSSGMVMRLAFSIAIHADPKAFVVDEALSVGDAYFQQKCMRKIKEFKRNGGSIIFVSHDMNAVKILCDKALLLDQGSKIEEGTPDKVINTYNFLLAKKGKGEEIHLSESADAEKSYGNLKVEIVDAKMLNKNDQDSDVLVSGEKCTVEIILKANETVNDITVGILIRDRFGQDVFGTNTYHLKVPISLKSGERCVVRYVMDEFNIGFGKYTLNPAVHRDDTHVDECFQWVDVIKTFEVIEGNDFRFIGFSRLKPRVQVDRV